ncbi:GMC family oxidoreductase [Rhizosaccharibacter radicis]|uniref:GMC family oxidoreductase n=1 Tax=Rhizosaccharibacter radicis TaxID=2782605 RepID=A0ABT1VUY4_9PROT|nr:GMC family oxidoreductase [Acetobacteraceae bacterium KSS12]
MTGILSLPERRFADEEVVDVVVVGTGAGGAPVLARLAAAGLRVVALEAGAPGPPRDHAADETEATELYWLAERLAGGTTPQPMGANNSGTGVGGSLLHWGAFVPRPDARDLRLRTETGRGRDWPFGLDALLPYLREVEEAIQVSGPRNYPWDPSRRYPQPPVARNQAADAMARACDSLGIRATDAPAALVTRDTEQPGFGTRESCIHCGACHQGCRNGSKAGGDTTFLPAAVLDGAEIRPNCMVTGIERDALGRVSAVIYREDGRERRQRCAALFLCAGAVETPRLLLHAGLCNGSGQVGRNYMAHVATQVWGTVDREIRPNKGYPSSLISEDMVRPADADFVGGYLVQSLGIMPVTWANQVARGRGLWGRGLTDYLAQYNRVIGIGINGDCLPYEENRLTLSDELDESGMPKPLISFSAGENEQRIHAHAERVLSRIWEEAGASDLWTLTRYAHTIGTCRMGPDGDDAVVDGRGRSFEIDNLWICDNSVFPSALSANPALTIMALGLRSADAFLGRLPA